MCGRPHMWQGTGKSNWIYGATLVVAYCLIGGATLFE